MSISMPNPGAVGISMYPVAYLQRIFDERQKTASFSLTSKKGVFRIAPARCRWAKPVADPQTVQMAVGPEGFGTTGGLEYIRHAADPRYLRCERGRLPESS